MPSGVLDSGLIDEGWIDGAEPPVLRMPLRARIEASATRARPVAARARATLAASRIRASMAPYLSRVKGED